jgi:hypothetical protein
LPQGFKNSPTVFGTALASILKAFSDDQHICSLLQYVDDLLLAGPTREDYIEGTCLLLSLLWDTKSQEKKPKFAKTLSNTSVFTCPRDNAGSDLKGNTLSVLSQLLRPTTKLERFWELQVSAESGSLTTPS